MTKEEVKKKGRSRPRRDQDYIDVVDARVKVTIAAIALYLKIVDFVNSSSEIALNIILPLLPDSEFVRNPDLSYKLGLLNSIFPNSI
jgi:hypothetical protein